MSAPNAGTPPVAAPTPAATVPTPASVPVPVTVSVDPRAAIPGHVLQHISNLPKPVGG